MWWAFEEANAPMVVGLEGKLDGKFMFHVRFDAVVRFEGETEDRWVFVGFFSHSQLGRITTRSKQTEKIKTNNYCAINKRKQSSSNSTSSSKTES